jgi:hypothetical protein
MRGTWKKDGTICLLDGCLDETGSLAVNNGAGRG